MGHCVTQPLGNSVTPSLGNYLTRSALELGNFMIADTARRHQQRRDVGDLVERELGLSPTRYFQLLLAMLERPEVAAADPELVTSLRAMRDRRRRR